MMALEQNDTWEVVVVFEGKWQVGCEGDYTVKLNPNKSSASLGLFT